VERWRRQQALDRTRRHRPDLLKEAEDPSGDQEG
jgi:tRNA G37 N-methylase TrmD